MSINIRISNAIRGRGGLAPTAAQLASYCGGVAVEYEAPPSISEVVMCSRPAGRLTAENSRRFPVIGGAAHRLISFLESGQAGRFTSRVLVTLEGGVVEKAVFRQIDDLVDLVILTGASAGEIVFTHRMPKVG